MNWIDRENRYIDIITNQDCENYKGKSIQL